MTLNDVLSIILIAVSGTVTFVAIRSLLRDDIVPYMVDKVIEALDAQEENKNNGRHGPHQNRDH